MNQSHILEALLCSQKAINLLDGALNTQDKAAAESKVREAQEHIDTAQETINAIVLSLEPATRTADEEYRQVGGDLHTSY